MTDHPGKEALSRIHETTQQEPDANFLAIHISDVGSIAEYVESLECLADREQHGRLVREHQTRGKQLVDAWATVKTLTHERDEAREALKAAETVLMLVEPRSHKREYLETLDQVRAALSKGSSNAE